MMDFMKWLLTCIWRGICSLLGIRMYNHKDEVCDSVLEPEVDFNMKELKQIIRQQILENFHLQRKSGSQFAVVLLLNGNISGQLEQLTFKPCDGNRKPLHNSNHAFYPPSTEYVNYIVARPSVKPNRLVKFFYLAVARSKHYQVHAEEFILPEFESFVERFKSCNHSYPNTVLLFSWLFPCTLCTDMIIERLTGSQFRQQYPTIQNVIVAYKTYWRRLSKEENEMNMVRLKQEGFKLVRVEYDEALPPL